MADNIDQLQSRAYAAWELHAYAEAAELFLSAAEAETDASKERPKWGTPDQTFLFRIRAAFCYWLDGQFEIAEPTLVEATTYDWKAARLWADRRDTEKAFAYLLANLATDGEPKRFSEMWRTASDRMLELEFPFPSIVPIQKLMLVSCLNLKFWQGCRQTIDHLNPKLVKQNLELLMLKQEVERAIQENE